MKAGDLVEYSAYKRALKNEYIFGGRKRLEDIALVVEYRGWMDWYELRWISDGLIQRGISRKELRQVRKK